MPIPLPNLDDRDFADLAAQARALIPALAPGWTDHNPSDPGIVLVELLAWLTEMLVFQANEIPDAHTLRFLALLNGPDWTPERPPAEEIARTVAGLRERYRAVTADDYEYLVGSAFGAAGWVRRVRCVVRRDLTAADPAVRDQPAPAHVSVVVLPEPGAGSHPQPTSELVQALWSFLDPRRTLTTRHHVVGPQYVPVTVSAGVALHADAPPGPALAAVADRLADFLDPYAGGQDGTGWPFGRDVYIADLYAALNAQPLVDYVEEVTVAGPTPLLRDDAGAVYGLALDEHQLVQLSAVQLTGYDSFGRVVPYAWGGQP